MLNSISLRPAGCHLNCSVRASVLMEAIGAKRSVRARQWHDEVNKYTQKDQQAPNIRALRRCHLTFYNDDLNRLLSIPQHLHGLRHRQTNVSELAKLIVWSSECNTVNMNFYETPKCQTVVKPEVKESLNAEFILW